VVGYCVLCGALSQIVAYRKIVQNCSEIAGGQAIHVGCATVLPRAWAFSASRKHRTLAGTNCRAGSARFSLLG
jgi:hypothetical protein